jgi:hypothetical protein
MNEPLVSQIYGVEPSLGNPNVDGYVLSSTIAGVRSWISSSGGGVTPTNGILYWNSSTNKYEPYSTQTIGCFDTSASFPVHTTTLNYDGYLYATSFISINPTGQCFIGISTSNTAIAGTTQSGTAITAGANTGTGLLSQSVSGVSFKANNALGNVSDILKLQLNSVDKFTVNKDGLPKSMALAGTGDRVVGVDSTGLFKIISTGGGAGTVTSITTTSPITGGTITTTGTIGITQATSYSDGYLTSTDWTIFNSKEASLTKGNLTETTSSVLTITGGTSSVIGTGVAIQVKLAGTSQSGYLSSANWNTFNNKEPALTKGNLTEVTSSVLTITGGSGAIIGSGTTILVKQASTSQSGYLSSTDWNIFNTKANTVYPYAALTDSATIVWNCTTGLNKTVSIATSRILSITNMSNGMSGDLILTVTSIATLTLPAGSKLNGSVTNLAVGKYHLAWIYSTVFDFNIALYA